MNIRISALVALVFLVIGVIGFSGCEKVTEIIDDSMMETEETIKIGLIQPTGSYESFAKGAELALSEVNASGGVMGKQIEFVRRDNAAGDTTAIVEELQGMGVSAILGPIFSSNTLPLRPIVKVPLLPGANSRAITEENDFIFIVGAANDLQASVIAEYATRALNAKTAATIGLGTDAYSMIITDAFQKDFMALGGETVSAQTYASGDPDFTTQLTAIQAANPDVIFFASWPPAVPLAMKQARDMGITAKFIGGDGWDEETFLTTLDDNAPLEGGSYSSNFSAQVSPEYAADKAQAFIAAYKDLHGQDPGGITAVGYDSVHLLAMAIESAQSTDPMMIRDALAAITNYSGATAISHFENQIAIKDLALNVIKDGKITLFSADDLANMDDMPSGDAEVPSDDAPGDDGETSPAADSDDDAPNGDGETSPADSEVDAGEDG